MGKKTKNILIGSAIGIVFGLITEPALILISLIMGAGIGYATSLENPKTKYLLAGFFAGGPLGCLIGYLIWAAKYAPPPSASEQDDAEKKEKTTKKNPARNNPKQISPEEEQIQFCFAVWALAQAACWADGEKSENENNEAKQALKALMDNFSEEQKKTILLKAKQFNETTPQPSLNDAFIEIKKLHDPNYMILDNVVQRIIRCNNEISDSEQKFMDAWQEYMDAQK